MSRLQAIGGHLSCILIDIDHFKPVNDTYGHKCGDHVLSGLARLVRAWLRLHDFVARYGGEEFVAVIEGDEQAAYSAAERIRQQTANVRFSHKGKSFRVTISAGVASRAFPSASLDAESLLTAADTAMYAAKRAGRNRVARASALGFAEESLSVIEKAPS